MSDTQELEGLWLAGVEARQEGREDDAADCFRKILAGDPRLAEPRMELAHMALARGDLEEAEEQARMAVDILGRGGQWIDDLEGHQLESFAHNLLGQALFERAEIAAADPDQDIFEDLWSRAAAAFQRAVELDPDNVDARRNAVTVRPRES